MRFYDFLKDKILLIILFSVSVLFCSFLIYGLGVGIYAAVFTAIILFAAFFAGIFAEYIVKKRFYDKLISEMQKIDKKYLAGQLMGQPDFFEGKLLLDIIKQAEYSMNSDLAKKKQAYDELAEYMEMWVHEIKTPIASAVLTCENNKGAAFDSIKEDIHKIERYIEQALYYSRANDVEKDYLIKEVYIEKIVSDILKRNSKMLIGEKISVKTNVFGKVYSDEKWIGFILDQIIVNAIKYHKSDPQIKIYTVKENENLILCVEDNGIGIPKKDIGRIFSKGFTGENGRKYTASTGMGLFLCKKLCDRLGLKITAVCEKTTIIKITFPKSTMYNFFA